MNTSLRQIVGGGLIGFFIWLISLIILSEVPVSHPQELQALGFLCWFSCPGFIIFPAIFVWGLRKKGILPQADSEKAKNSEPENPIRFVIKLITFVIYAFIAIFIVTIVVMLNSN